MRRGKGCKMEGEIKVIVGKMPWLSEMEGTTFFVENYVLNHVFCILKRYFLKQYAFPAQLCLSSLSFNSLFHLPFFSPRHNEEYCQVCG